MRAPAVRFRPIILLVVVLAGAFAIFPASGAAPRAGRVTSVAAGSLDPDIANADRGLKITSLTPSVRKAKIQFTFPDATYLRSNLQLCSLPTNNLDSTVLGCDFLATSPDVPLPSDIYTSSNITLYGGTADSYIATSSGQSSTTYGELPPIRVKALGFGSVPISATVHLSQAISRGTVAPLRIPFAYLTIVGDLPAGTRVWPGFPGTPAFDASKETLDLYLYTTITGKFDVRVSDVSVDGHPLNVGKSCETSTPATLRADAPTGYFKPSPDINSTDTFPRGTAGSFNPQGNVPGYFDGTVDIPSFRGCGSGKQNLDPLVTSLVSGPGNPISGFDAIQVSQPSLAWCMLPVAHCTEAQAAGQRRMQALAAAVATHKSPAVIKKLQAKIKPADAVMPKVKAPKGLGGS